MAAGFSERVLDEIKSRIDLADLIASYGVSVRTAGSSKKACCPFHHEKTPSFHINEAKGFYHCFGCGESGDAISFVMKMESLPFVEAVEKLAQRAGVTLERAEDPDALRRTRLFALLAELAQFYHRCLLSAKEGERARAYVGERALDGAVAEKYLIGYAPVGIRNIRVWAKKYGYSDEELEAAGVVKLSDRPGDAGFHRFGGRLVFPICDSRARIAGFSARQLVPSKRSGKYVNSPETLVFKKSKVLYGFDKAATAIAKNPHHEALVCEGQIDCIRLQTSGFPNAVAGQGTAFTAEHAHLLKKVADQVVLVYDDDAAGHKATLKTARLCLSAELPVRVVSLPDGHDPDSFLRAHAADDFRKLLEKPESIMAFQVRVAREGETLPDSVDAVNRVVKEILTTIASCPQPVLRATMLKESARLLSLPYAALDEELQKVSVDAPKNLPPDEEEVVFPVEDLPTVAEGGEASASLPPPPAETAFCEFLLRCERLPEAKGVGQLIEACLPPCVFAHPFTGAFVKTWCAEAAGSDDLIAPWSETLPPDFRALFDALLTAPDKTQASARDVVDLAQDFVRTLWVAHLKRLRGNLPAAGDEDASRTRMDLTLKIKRLPTAPWEQAKDVFKSLTDAAREMV